MTPAGVTPAFRIEALDPTHDRTRFRSGVVALDDYLARQAGQDVRRRASACFLAIDAESGRIAGYYTLAAASVALTDLPQGLARKLPRYPSVPVARLGRLAIDTGFQGRKLGAALLADALTRAMRSEVAVLALVVDAKDDRAAAFYRHHGFEPFSSTPLRFFLAFRR